MICGPVSALPVAASLLGESPFWLPESGGWLWWCDIAGRQLNALQPATMSHAWWRFDTEPCCAAPMDDGQVMVALRDGIHRFQPASSRLQLLAKAPYDTSVERFNDGKADPQGRLWVGSMSEPRLPTASLYRYGGGFLKRMAGDITVSNGLAFSPDGRTMYRADTAAHTVFAHDFNGANGSIGEPRVLARFEPKVPGRSLADYGGRPDGAAVDAEGCYWVAMYEGARVVRLSPAGEMLGEIALPVRCPTMPCFGGADLRTLFVTTARHGRPEDELARDAWAGQVLQMRVDVPGLPVHKARL